MTDKQLLYERLMARANRQGILTNDLGMTVTEITDGCAVGMIRFSENSINPRKLVHGGALFAVMDQLCGMAACTTGFGTTTINGSIDFLRPTCPGNNLTCRATVLRPGRRFTVCEAEVTDMESGKLIAKGSFTYCMMEELKPREMQVIGVQD